MMVIYSVQYLKWLKYGLKLVRVTLADQHEKID